MYHNLPILIDEVVPKIIVCSFATSLDRINSQWTHDIEAFSALQALCEGKPPFFFDVSPNELFDKQSMYQWFETL